MKILNKLTIAAALATPIIGSGCSTSLKELQSAVPKISLFDNNKDNKLDESEVQKYVDAEIICGNKNLTNSEIAGKVLELFYSIDDYFKDHGKYPYSQNLWDTRSSFLAVRNKYWEAAIEDDKKIIRHKQIVGYGFLPLSDERFKKRISGLHLFDTNNNGILEPEEIDLFIKIRINGNNDKFTEEGKKELSDVIDFLYKECKIYPRYIGPADMERPYQRPLNIVTTVRNLEAKLGEYERRLISQAELEIKEQINKALKR